MFAARIERPIYWAGLKVYYAERVRGLAEGLVRGMRRTPATPILPMQPVFPSLPQNLPPLPVPDAVKSAESRRALLDWIDEVSPTKLRNDPGERRMNRKRVPAVRASLRRDVVLPAPRFTPFHQESLSFRDPWTVRSLRDLFAIYLPEISISAAAVTASGFLADRIYRGWVIDAVPLLAPATYLGALLLFLSSIYIQGRCYPSAVTRARIHSVLLATLALLGMHLLAFFILRAAV
jgi:hypothetical protein